MQPNAETIHGFRDQIVGIGRPVPLLDGTTAPYVNLDNAASTPALKCVAHAVEEFLPFYSSVHRGSGFKSRLSTAAYDAAHEIIGRFVGADLTSNTVIFGKNTTEATNKLSYRLSNSPDDVVITTVLEHHSNDLPWRRRGKVVHVRATREGRLDEEDFDRQLQLHKGHIALVTVAGASNVSGFVQPIHRLARKAHEAGTRILVDVAQMALHRQVDMKPDDDAEHLDFVALSGHKMYAPFGTGALVGPRAVFEKSPPEYCGGGTVSMVTLDDVQWSGSPDRDEAGSPNVVGAVAMAAAAKCLMETGMDTIAEHENNLVVYALDRLAAMPSIKLFGETDPARSRERVGVIPFNVAGVSHFKVAAILGYEGGVGVRSGCFCAHPYVLHLLDLGDCEMADWRIQMLGGDRRNMPGLVRASFGCYNTTDDIDRLIAALEMIIAGSYRGDYVVEKSSGEFTPRDWQEELGSYFKL